MPRAIISVRHDMTADDNIRNYILPAARQARIPISLAMQGNHIGRSGAIDLDDIAELAAEGVGLTVHGWTHKWPAIMREGLGSPQADLDDNQFGAWTQEDIGREASKAKELLEGEGHTIRWYQCPYNYGNRSLLYSLIKAGYEGANCLIAPNKMSPVPKVAYEILISYQGENGTEIVTNDSPVGLTAGATVYIQQLAADPDNAYHETATITSVDTETNTVYLSGTLTNTYSSSGGDEAAYIVQYATVASNVTNSTTVPIDIPVDEFSNVGIMFTTPAGSKAYRTITGKNAGNRTITVDSAVTLPAGTTMKLYKLVSGDLAVEVDRLANEPVMGVDGQAKFRALTNVGGSSYDLNEGPDGYQRTWAQVQDCLIRLLIGTGYVGTVTFHDIGEYPTNESSVEHYERLWAWCKENDVEIVDVDTLHEVYTKHWKYPAHSKSWNCCLNGEQRYYLSTAPTQPYLSYDYSNQACTYHPPTESGAPLSISDGKACGWSTVGNGKWLGLLCRFWEPGSRHRIRIVCRKTPGYEPSSGNMVVKFAGFRWSSGPFYWERPLLSKDIPVSSIGTDWTTIEVTDTEPGVSGVWLGGLNEGLLYIQNLTATNKYLDIAEIRVERV